MLFDNIANLAQSIVTGGAADNAADVVESVKKMGSSKRPADLDTDGKLRRLYFKGKHLPAFKMFIATIYPEAARNNEIHPVTVNFLRTWCEHDADIYRAGQPFRTTKSGGNKGAEKRMSELSDAASLDTVLPDAEVKSHAAREMFLKAMRNPKTDALDVTKHWPDQVWIVCDDSAPLDLNESKAVMLEIRSNVFELWRPVVDNRGKGWMAHHVTTEGPNAGVRPILEQTYYGRIPIVGMYTSDPDDSPFLDDGADLVKNADNYMLALTDSFHIARAQAHSPIYTTGAGEVTPHGGPGGLTELPEGATMGAVPVEAQIDQVRALTNDFAAVVALSRNQPQRSYTTNPEPLNSSLALRADNQIAEEKRPQRIALMTKFDIALIKILDEVDRFMIPRHGKRIPGAPLPDDVKSVFPRAPTIEDVQQKQLRLEHAVAQRWIDRAEAAVRAGYWPDRETALARMPKDDEGPAVPAPDLGARMRGERGPPPGLAGGTDG